jgi:hypothetical protein
MSIAGPATTLDPSPGRSCPLSYRYGPSALANVPQQTTDTLYVIGGLYGNLPALAALRQLAAREAAPATLCFNGDFNWFNVDDAGFVAINQAVLDHDACLGNVEAELLSPDDDAGCGCAYPADVDAGTVERSNRIHARLKQTAQAHPELLRRLANFRCCVATVSASTSIGVVHGDAESLAGWGFDIAALDAADKRDWIAAAFREAGVEVFASSHTCLPALRTMEGAGVVINNGAAGMPNFRRAPVRRGHAHRRLAGADSRALRMPAWFAAYRRPSTRLRQCRLGSRLPRQLAAGIAGTRVILPTHRRRPGP